MKFWYHMYGATMGTLTMEVWDGSAWLNPTTMPAAGFTMSGDQGDTWFSANVPLLPYVDAACPMSTAAKFRFIGTRGTSFTGDMAIDDVTVFDGVLAWETNDPTSSLDIDGVQGDPFVPAIVNKIAYSCPGGVTPVTSTFTLSSNLPGNVFDIVTSGAPLVPATGGGTTLPDGQFVNIDLLQPFSFVGGGLPLFLPGANFPGSNQVSLTIGTSLNTATNLAAQAVVFDPTAPLGFSLSQGVELNLVIAPPVASIPGPTTVSGLTTVDVTAAPTCWAPGGIPFYGGVFNTMTVFAGGTIQFGGTDTDTSPSILDAIGDDGRVGFWTSMDPSEGGAITISSPAPNIIRADWAGVFYDGGGPGNTFGIEIDCLTGVIKVDGLGGLVPNPSTSSVTDDQWLGISPGITFAPAVTTDPGATGFGLGLNGVAALETDMLYEFNDVSVSLSGLPASVLGGMTTLMFTPTTVGMGTNYQWSGM